MNNVFWFRRDLRLDDNAGLFHALNSSMPVQCIFIFDKNILDELEVDDARVHFIYQQLQTLNEQLNKKSSSLQVFHSTPEKVFQKLTKNNKIHSVFANSDYEPYALQRDSIVSKLLEKNGTDLHLFKDHVVFEKDEVMKADATPYTVFTPYKRKWLAKLHGENPTKSSVHLKSFKSSKLANYALSDHSMPSLSDIGFTETQIEFPAKTVKQSLIKKYQERRDFPAVEGTSRLGIHFRFGTISIREKARKSEPLSATFLSELIWRDFYAQILFHFPHVVNSAFRAKYDSIVWRENEKEFEAWCSGKTGYPLVDAGMRELNATGHMHNRVRMITASFLTKHLLMDWRKGEAYFAKKLLDFDLASNNGGWQWAAGCGTDAAPYFRIFNPTTQLKKFDKDLIYVKKWLEEYGTEAYPEPIVEHKFARERCLTTYKAALSKF